MSRDGKSWPISSFILEYEARDDGLLCQYHYVGVTMVCWHLRCINSLILHGAMQSIYIEQRSFRVPYVRFDHALTHSHRQSGIIGSVPRAAVQNARAALDSRSSFLR